MSWNPLKIPEAIVTGYNIQWRIDDEYMDTIVLGRVNKYTMRDLLPGQTIETSVCARFNKVVYRNGNIPVFCSYREYATIPTDKGGWLSLTFRYT